MKALAKQVQGTGFRSPGAPCLPASSTVWLQEKGKSTTFSSTLVPSQSIPVFPKETRELGPERPQKCLLSVLFTSSLFSSLSLPPPPFLLFFNLSLSKGREALL